VTDEPGFVVVNARDGVSIKIGDDPTAATYRAANLQEFLVWLAELVVEPKSLAAPSKSAGVQ